MRKTPLAGPTNEVSPTTAPKLHAPRGAFYTTLDRLDAKGLVRWTTGAGGEGRAGLPQRTFVVTPDGLAALRASRKALLELWSGLDEVLRES